MTGTRQSGEARSKEVRISSWCHALTRLLLVVVLSFGSYLFFSRMVVTAVEVRGSSMAPTLQSGDRVILNRVAFLHRSPQRGELVVLKDPETGELVVKRIIGLPSESISLLGDQVYVNNQRLIEPYVSASNGNCNPGACPSTTIPAEHYYVLGDNRPNSADSRTFGPVARENIIGVISL